MKISITMKTSIILSTIALASTLALALPTTTTCSCPTPAPSPVPFSIVALNSGSSIDLQTVNAHDTFFYIGERTTSYCPLIPSTSCPAGLFTRFLYGDGGLSLSTQVPGGQAVYIGPKGALRFTIAHSTYEVPGSTVDGFTKQEMVGFGQLEHVGGFLACPVEPTDAAAAAGPWMVYVGQKGFVQQGCVGFEALTDNGTSIGAWQYV